MPLWMHICKGKDICLIILFDCYLPQYLLKATLLIHMKFPLKLLSCTCGRWNLQENLHAITHLVFLGNTVQKKTFFIPCAREVTLISVATDEISGIKAKVRRQMIPHENACLLGFSNLCFQQLCNVHICALSSLSMPSSKQITLLRQQIMNNRMLNLSSLEFSLQAL